MMEPRSAAEWSERPGVGVEAQNPQWIDSGRARVVPSLRNAARRRRLAAVLSVTRDSGCEKVLAWPGVRRRSESLCRNTARNTPSSLEDSP